MDFFKITERSPKKGVYEIFPSFRVMRSKDLMIRGKSFYAIWDEEKGLWSTDEYDVQRLVDKELREFAKAIENRTGGSPHVKYMSDFTSNSWTQFRAYMSQLSDNAVQLDDNLTFLNDEVTRKDHVSKRLPYPLAEGTTEAWDLLMDTLYDPEEKEKIEWAIGAIVAGEAKHIHKFLVLYGDAGTGKSTVLNIIQKLFQGYYVTFEAKSLGSSNNAFSTESFKGNPLVAIEHDGDLSKIEDNTKLNSLVAHEEMTRNEKNRPIYTAKSNAFLFIGTNKPVKITDSKSGLIRRLIDAKSSGRLLPIRQYQAAISQVEFELGAIAYKCQEVFKKLGKDYYLGYKPTAMMYETDVFFNYVESMYYTFKQQDGTTLTQAWEAYKAYIDETAVGFKLPRHKFREELRTYFKHFMDRGRLDDGTQIRSIYSGFKADKFISFTTPKEEEQPFSLVMDSEASIFDKTCDTYQAQYAHEELGTPLQRWSNVRTTLKDIDTTKLHYVVLGENHIVIDFDLKDDTGEKSLELNLEAASKWPPTYAEFSKSGKGVHLHYIYDGDATKLANVYSDGIEIKKTVVGDNGPTSLRRKYTRSNNLDIAHIASGLPLKGEKMYDPKAVMSERAIRDLIVKNLNKEIHPGTKPSIDFIYKILEDAYKSGVRYDVTQLRPDILAFAMNSTNQADYCVKLVSKMKFESQHQEEDIVLEDKSDEPLVFYDVEVFKNLLIVCWQYDGEDQPVVSMINPTPDEIETLLKKKLVGFNNRRYDNHILYARLIGYDNERIFDISSKIVAHNSQNGYFREAYNLSYTDVYDFASAGNKKSLKKWEIELGIHHQELGHPWDQPIPEERWLDAVEYCKNDVIATKVVFHHLSGDWEARKVVAELSGLTVNHTTNQHSIKIVFGDEKNPNDHLVYTDLSDMFPGYKFDAGKSIYRGEEVGEGGYVYSEPGIYEDIALLDVASMHPASLENLNLFGKYTKRFSDIRKARICIKRKLTGELETLLDGKLIPFIKRAEIGEFSLKDLSEGLKTVLNSAYGLTSASFDNPFRDPRNIDNIVAKRGALFMIDLKYAVQERGYTVAHIKTDSIKIPNATSEIIKFIFEFGKKYGYEFEHEKTFDSLCLVNDAVYIASFTDKTGNKHWTATGAQFQHPFVFKTLFSKEPIEFSDLCEAKSVTGTSALYLDMNEEKEDEHNYQFVGRVGLFCPVEPGTGGGFLMREKEGKYYAATGTKGYRWLEAEVVKSLGLSDQIDMSYFEKLVSDAIDHISKFGDFNSFVSE